MEKKVSDVKILAQKWSKTAETKKKFLTDFISSPLITPNPLGKIIERNGLRFEYFCS